MDMCKVARSFTNSAMPFDCSRQLLTLQCQASVRHYRVASPELKVATLDNNQAG